MNALLRTIIEFRYSFKRFAIMISLRVFLFAILSFAVFASTGGTGLYSRAQTGCIGLITLQLATYNYGVVSAQDPEGAEDPEGDDEGSDSDSSYSDSSSNEDSQELSPPAVEVSD